MSMESATESKPPLNLLKVRVKREGKSFSVMIERLLAL